VLGKLEDAVHALNWHHRVRDYFFRRAFFAESLQRRLAEEGKNLDELVDQRLIGSIPDGAIKGAVTDALQKTFAEELPARGGIVSDLLHSLSRIPFSPVPFVRFTTAALKFQFEYSPLGAVRLLHPTKALASSEPKQLEIASKASAGSAMLYGAYLLRNSSHGGPEWYDVKIGNRTIDMRPFAPLSSYLFVAGLIKRQQDGTLLSLDAKDIAQGLASVNFRAGAVCIYC